MAAGIGGTVEFRTDVFDVATIDTLIARLARVLAAMTADPEQRVGSVDVLDTDEYHRIDALGNRAALSGPAPEALSIPALFGAQVVASPDGVALRCGDVSHRYADLDAVANQWAQVLVDLGAGVGVVGLTLANVLGLQGVRTLLVEERDSLIDYPRGVGLDDESLRTFQAIGLVDKVLPHTVPNQILRFFDANRKLLVEIDRKSVV